MKHDVNPASVDLVVSHQPLPRRLGGLARTAVRLLLSALALLVVLHAAPNAWAQGGALPADNLFPPSDAAPAEGGSPAGDEGSLPDLGGALNELGSGTSREECAKTNTAVIVGAVVVDVAALILFFILFWVIARRGRSHPWVVFFGVLIVMAAAAALVIGFQHSDPETLLRCRRTTELAGVLIFDGFADWQRGLLLGAAPVIVLGTLLKVIWALIRR